MTRTRFNPCLIALLSILLIGSSATAQRLKIVGDKEVQQFGYAELAVDGVGSTVLWDVSPEPVQLTTDKLGVLRFGGVPGQSYVVKAVIVDFDKKTVTQERITVVFTGNGPAPPGPPGPNPPTPPLDPLLQALQAAYLSEPEKNLIPALATFYINSRPFVDEAKTWGELNEKMTGEANRLGVAGKVKSIQTVLQGYLQANLPSKGAANVAIDASGKTQAKAVFTKIADSLGKVGK